jgi:hypothetical protein
LPAKNAILFNEFGYTVGGPVLVPRLYNGKNRTFFFHSYEGLRERTAPNYATSVATEAMRNGDFSGLPAILDPLAGTPFAGNRVPLTRIDSRSKTFIGYVPLPNTPGLGPAGTLTNYRWTIANISDINRWGVRLDHRFSEKDSIWVHLNYSKGFPYFVAVGYPSTYGNWVNGGYSTQSGNLTWNHTFSPRVLNEFRFVYFRHASTRNGLNRDFDPRSLFSALYPTAYGGLPNINITSHIAIGDYGGGDPGVQLTPQFIDNITLVRGRHTVKAGMDLAIHKVLSPPFVSGMGSGLANNAALGRFDFNGRYTLDDKTKTAQPAHAFADFLLGYPVSAYRSTTSPNLLLVGPRYSFFVQDDWVVNPRLTLNFGLRYMYQTPWWERNNTISNFDFQSGRLVVQSDKLPSQAQERLVRAYPIVLAAEAGVPVDDIAADRNNFGPRAGFAWRPFGNTRTVVRGGAGVYFNFLPIYIGFRQRGFNNPPFLLGESFEAAAGYTPSITLASPFPGGGAISPNPSLTAVQKNIRNSESYQWNLTLEREVRANLGLRASYVGNHSTHLPWYNYPVNLSRQQISGALQPNRPYQPWSDILVLAGGGNSILHQLQIEAIQRYAHGLNFQLEYSWNRSLDDVPVTGGPQDPYNARTDRGNSDQIRRHILTLTGSHELPFGPGKKFLNSRHPAVRPRRHRHRCQRPEELQLPGALPNAVPRRVLQRPESLQLGRAGGEHLGDLHRRPDHRRRRCEGDSIRPEVRREVPPAAGRRTALQEGPPGSGVSEAARFPGRQHGRVPARVQPGAEIDRPEHRLLHERRRARRQLGHRPAQPRPGGTPGPARQRGRLHLRRPDPGPPVEARTDGAAAGNAGRRQAHGHLLRGGAQALDLLAAAGARTAIVVRRQYRQRGGRLDGHHPLRHEPARDADPGRDEPVRCRERPLLHRHPLGGPGGPGLVRHHRELLRGLARANDRHRPPPAAQRGGQRGQ